MLRRASSSDLCDGPMLYDLRRHFVPDNNGRPLWSVIICGMLNDRSAIASRRNRCCNLFTPAGSIRNLIRFRPLRSLESQLVRVGLPDGCARRCFQTVNTLSKYRAVELFRQIPSYSAIVTDLSLKFAGAHPGNFSRSSIERARGQEGERTCTLDLLPRERLSGLIIDSSRRERRQEITYVTDEHACY